MFLKKKKTSFQHNMYIIRGSFFIIRREPEIFRDTGVYVICTVLLTAILTKWNPFAIRCGMSTVLLWIDEEIVFLIQFLQANIIALFYTDRPSNIIFCNDGNNSVISK